MLSITKTTETVWVNSRMQICIGNHMNSSAIWEIIALSHALEGVVRNFTRRSRVKFSRVKFILLMHGV